MYALYNRTKHMTFSERVLRGVGMVLICVIVVLFSPVVWCVSTPQ